MSNPGLNSAQQPLSPADDVFASVTCYAPGAELLTRARKISLLLLDVDGVLTSGQLYFTEQGETIKAFNTLDGQGIKLLQEQGIDVGIISGRKSPALGYRAQALGITLLALGREDKFTALMELLANRPLELDKIAYIGDDLPDLLVMRHIGLALAVPAAHGEIHHYAQGCTRRAGGDGAVRDACDFILKAQNKYQAAIARFLKAPDHMSNKE